MPVRILRLAVVPLMVALAVAAVAAPAAAKSKKPVKLSGSVNNKGIGTATSGQAQIELDNFFFKKTFLKATAGTVTVQLENGGSVPHTFTIDAQNIDETLQPGDTKSVTVNVTAGKPTAFYCRFHKGQGMQGAFFTKAGAVANNGTKSSPGSGSYGY